MRQEHYRMLAIGLGMALIVAVFIAIGVLFTFRGRSAPEAVRETPVPVASAPEAITPEPVPAPVTPVTPPSRARGVAAVRRGGAIARPQLQMSPATLSGLQLKPVNSADATQWNKFEDGCEVALNNGVYQIDGAIDGDWKIYWNGIVTAQAYPEGDFIFSAEWKSPGVKDPGFHEMSISAVTDSGFGNLHFSQGGGYWLEFGAQNTLNVRTFGDEATAFHRISLQYNAATKEFRAWTDNTNPVMTKRGLMGRQRFALAINAEPGAKIDVQFKKVQLLTGAEATKVLRP